MCDDVRVIEVVGAVIVHDGLVLRAQKASGEWEFPGGKVEPGESHEAAVRREVSEELGVSVVVGNPITTTTLARTDGATLRLTTYWCALKAGELTPTEHCAVEWCPREKLANAAWSAMDIATVQIVAASQCRID